MRLAVNTGRRFISAVSGPLILLVALFETYNLFEDLYYNYYFYPSVKDGYIIPARWQEIVALIVLWAGTILLWYVAYRLLRYAFAPGLSRRSETRS
jgi:hypothetical protein